MIGSELRNLRACRPFAGAMLALVVLLLAACDSTARGSGNVGIHARASTGTFVSALRQVSFDYEVHASPEVLAKEAALTVSGTITSVDDGRVFGVGPDRNTEPRFLNATLTVLVDSVLAGDTSLANDKTIYVEVPRSAETSIADMRRSMPDGQKVLLFLSDYTEVGGSFPEIEPSPVIPRGETIFAPYADGFLMQDSVSGAVIGVLEPLDNLPEAWQNGTQDLNTYIRTHFNSQ